MCQSNNLSYILLATESPATLELVLFLKKMLRDNQICCWLTHIYYVIKNIYPNLYLICYKRKLHNWTL